MMSDGIAITTVPCVISKPSGLWHRDGWVSLDGDREAIPQVKAQKKETIATGACHKVVFTSQRKWQSLLEPLDGAQNLPPKVVAYVYVFK